VSALHRTLHANSTPTAWHCKWQRQRQASDRCLSRRRSSLLQVQAPTAFLTRLILPSSNDCSSLLEHGDNVGILHLNCIEWSLRRTGAMAGRRNKEVIWQVAKYGLVPHVSPQRRPGPHAGCDWSVKQIIGSPVFHCQGRHDNLYVMVPRPYCTVRAMTRSNNNKSFGKSVGTQTRTVVRAFLRPWHINGEAPLLSRVIQIFNF
jgi:hypothetical protein